MRQSNINLIVFRLYDPSYGESGNSKTLAVTLRPDNTIGYSYYGGWQSSGMGFAISNMGMRKELPMSINRFKSVEELEAGIVSCLRTGYGSSKVKTKEILNQFPTKETSESEMTKRLECIKRCNQEIQDVLNEVGLDDSAKSITSVQQQEIRRISNDINIAMDLSDDEPITENWYGLFS
jgi:hypothetical protein